MKLKKADLAIIELKKAFDSVNRSKLFSIISKLGIKDKSLKAIMRIYNNVSACAQEHYILVSIVRLVSDTAATSFLYYFALS